MIGWIRNSWRGPEMKILAHLRELDESLKDWQRYQNISLEDLKKERDKRNMILHAMLVSIQATIDVATYLIQYFTNWIRKSSISITISNI